jgi:hypothetical protein
MRRTGGGIALALAFALVAPVSGVDEPSPVRADCARQALSSDIRSYRGFAFEGVVRSVEGRHEPEEGWIYRLTIDVTEMLAGAPAEEVAFDLGTGSCWYLQGDRYKPGDRLIVSATGPPTGSTVAYLPDALTWRYEWADRWSLHGLADQDAASFPESIRGASTREGILALVAPDRLPYAVAPDAWQVTLARRARNQQLLDVVPWGEGFVALGRRGDAATIWTSATGDVWQPVRSRFREIDEETRLTRLVEFRGELYAVGIDRSWPRVWRAADGERWVPVALGPPRGIATIPSMGIRLVGVAATHERMVIITGRRDGDGAADVAWTTTDGTTWQRSEPTGLFGPVTDVTTGPNGFLARACMCSRPDEQWSLHASNDGVTWLDVGDLPSESHGIAAGETGPRYLAATIGRHEDERAFAGLDASVDGSSWSRIVTAPGIRASSAGVAAADETIVLLTSSHIPEAGTTTMVSSDAGATWTLSPLARADEAECVTKTAVGATMLVAIGGCSGTLAWGAQR